VRIGGNWYALVCENGQWIGGHNANGAIDVINLSAGTPSIVKTITTSGVYPCFASITPDGHTALVLDTGSTGLSFRVCTIDLTAAISSWALTIGPSKSGTIYNPQDLLMARNGTTAWFADAGAAVGGSNQLWPITVSGPSIGPAIACSSEPGSLAITPDSAKLWVGCAAANKLIRIDTASLAVDDTITFTGTTNGGGSAYPLTITPGGDALYWAEGGPPGHLWTMPTGGASPTPSDTGVKIPGFGSYTAAIAPNPWSLLGASFFSLL
jgi:DNA-binding beta-propeller fold protein YncE